MPRDEAAAVEWWRKAAAQGDEDAAKELRKRGLLQETEHSIF